MRISSLREPFLWFLKAAALYILGITLAGLLIYLNFHGFLAVWSRIPKPPEQPNEILTAGQVLFIKSVEGRVYSIDTRRNAGWVLVSEQVDPGSYFRCYPDKSNTLYDIQSHPAFLRFRNQIIDCQVAPLVYENVVDDLVFVLLKDGAIYRWHNRDGLDIWLLILCIVPIVTMILGMIIIRGKPVLNQEPGKDSGNFS